MNLYATRVFLGLCLVLAAMTVQADVVSIETGGALSLLLNQDNYVPYEACSGETPGGTSLIPLQHLLPEYDFPAVELALNIQYPEGTTDAGQSFEYEYGFSNTGLSGTMLVDYYSAVDDDLGYDCHHGAEIVVYYDRGEGEENLNLQFIQVYSETGEAISHPTRHTNIVDSLTRDDNPAYFGEGDEFYIPEGYEEASGEHDLTWSDAPSDGHEESTAWSGQVSFNMFLASYGEVYADAMGGFHQDVTIYEGISWGYSGICEIEPVPLPKSFGLACTGLLIILCARKIRRTARTK